ncbi:MAG: undecaprenyl-diphosphatase UppP [Parcubacteria group bacterium]|nr:undecaprenyl-diphosphatase UppP [Parcubacteria group bacterium]
MNIIQSTILGLIQGLTEFIPVSSSGHLVIVREIFGIEDLGIAFDAFLHLGTLLAVLIYFRKDFINIVKEKNIKFLKQVVIAIIPAGIIGLLFEDVISNFFRSTLGVSILMIAVGTIFIIAEKYNKIQKDKKEIKDITPLDALIIGLLQILALLPGVSRSGITISAGMFRKIKRVEATRFSFIMSAVIIFAASGKGAISLFTDTGSMNELVVIIWGGVVAFISGYLSIKFLMNYLKKHKLYIFSIYLFVVGTILLVTHII